jgi:hypothetical protein
MPVSAENSLGHLSKRGPCSGVCHGACADESEGVGEKIWMAGLRAPPERWAGGQAGIREYLPPPNEVPMAEFGEPLAEDPAASETPTSGNPFNPSKFRESLPRPIGAELPGQVKPSYR